jgi:hypothetical protein
MGFWDIAQWAAWIISALLFLWMLVDAYRVGRDYDEAVLLSSREGVDDLFGDAGQGK